MNCREEETHEIRMPLGYSHFHVDLTHERLAQFLGPDVGPVGPVPVPGEVTPRIAKAKQLDARQIAHVENGISMTRAKANAVIFLLRKASCLLTNHTVRSSRNCRTSSIVIFPPPQLAPMRKPAALDDSNCAQTMSVSRSSSDDCKEFTCSEEHAHCVLLRHARI